MSKYIKLPKFEGYTRQQCIACMKIMLKTNITAMELAFKRLISYQTNKELQKYRSIDNNNSGFDLIDAPRMTKIYREKSFAQHYKYMSNALPKYAIQLISTCNQKNFKRSLDLFYEV